jgi:16S rRNA (guanine527-N7)-methyltransferase
MSALSFGPQDFQARTGVSRETLERFSFWRERLAETNAHTNLVGRSTLDDFWYRHALDSWQAYAQFQTAARWADLGSGAGFPGLAIAFGLMDRGVANPSVTLVESIGKKARFLSQIAEDTAAPVTVCPVRVEHMSDVPAVDVVTARAMAPLEKLLGYVHPFVEKGALALLPKGRSFNEELTVARKSWTFDVEVLPSLTSDEAVLLKIGNLHRV